MSESGTEFAIRYLTELNAELDAMTPEELTAWKNSLPEPEPGGIGELLMHAGYFDQFLDDKSPSAPNDARGSGDT